LVENLHLKKLQVKPTMITPVVTEAEWLESLRQLPLWIPPNMPTIIISPHPDDETLGLGGLIAHLREKETSVLVVAVTDGENAYENTVGLGEVRRVEQINALHHLGVSADQVVRLELPDSDVSSCEQQLVTQLVPLVPEGAHIIAPWPGDFHPDHEASGRAAIEVARRTGTKLTFYFFWTWHRGTPTMLPTEGLHAMELSETALSAKTRALRCHQSQLEHISGEPILPDYLLGPARRGFEVFLVQ